MKIVIACDSFKGCMTSQEVCRNIEKGIHRANPKHHCVLYPMADGGEGTAECFAQVMQGDMITMESLDAYGKKITVQYARKEKLAVMDVATCIGLNMYPREARNPMIAHSRGVGKMMKHAIAHGCTKLVIGLGGSCTNDGGMGILYEFGARFYDSHHKLLEPSVYALSRIAYIDKRHFHLPHVECVAACDVENHLLGKSGATFIFGKQKGLFVNQFKEIDQWMTQYRDKVQQTFHVDMNEMPGGGAAGGIGGVLMGVFHAKMQPGIQWMIEESKMKEAVKNCDLVITGEGQTDAQTMFGKVPFGISQLAQSYSKPTICLSGALGNGYEALYQAGVIGIFSSADRAMTFQQALHRGPEKIEALAFNVTKCIDGLKGIL